MKQIRPVMGMPITIEIADAQVSAEAFEPVYAYLNDVDATFSPYKEHSEVTRVNRGDLKPEHASADFRQILALAEQTRLETNGYFDVMRAGMLDPSGIVKGWAIWRAAQRLRNAGYCNFYIDAGGDIQTFGRKHDGTPWIVGVCNPFEPEHTIKRIAATDCGIATSGLYQRGRHIYNPHDFDDALEQVASITVVGPNIYEADRFATAAFAMGSDGIDFIASLEGFEGYAVTHDRRATMTPGFQRLAQAAALSS